MKEKEIRLIKDLYKHFKPDIEVNDALIDSCYQQYGTIRGVLMNLILKFEPNSDVSDEYLDNKLASYGIQLGEGQDSPEQPSVTSKEEIPEKAVQVEPEKKQEVLQEKTKEIQEKTASSESNNKKKKSKTGFIVFVSIIVVLGVIIFLNQDMLNSKFSNAIEDKSAAVSDTLDDYQIETDIIRQYVSAIDNKDIIKAMSYWHNHPEKYWSLYYPNILDIESKIKDSWRVSSYSKNNIVGIVKVDKNTYHLSTNFTHTSRKTGITETITAKVGYIFNNKHMIISSYGIKMDNSKSENDEIYINSGTNDIKESKPLGVINDPDGYTNVRAGKSSSSEIIYQIYDENKRFKILNDNSEWWKIKFDINEHPYEIVGFIHNSRVERIVNDESFVGKNGFINGNNINFRSTSEINNHNIITQLQHGTNIYVLETVNKMLANIKHCIIENKITVNIDGNPTVFNAGIMLDVLSMKESNVICGYEHENSKYYKFSVDYSDVDIARQEKWYKIEIEDGTVGYVYSRFITKTNE